MKSDVKYEWLDDSVKNLSEPGAYIVDADVEAHIDDDGNLELTYKMKNVRRQENKDIK